MAKNWTEEDAAHIRRYFLTQTYAQLAEHFGVTTKAMESKIRRMGLKKKALLAETVDPIDVEPVVHYEQPLISADPETSPIGCIHKLERRVEMVEESVQERKVRIQQTREAAEREKARRADSRAEESVAAAIEKFEAGIKKLLAGKHAQAAKDFQAILDNPPSDVGLVARARQYLAAADVGEAAAPAPKTADDMYHHGVVLMNDGDFAAALKVFEKAAKKAPKDDRIAYVRAVALALSEEEEAALEMLAAAIKINEVNRVYARNDPDFSGLAASAEFRTLTAPPVADDAEA